MVEEVVGRVGGNSQRDEEEDGAAICLVARFQNKCHVL
jgi:hypothetical protein